MGGIQPAQLGLWPSGPQRNAIFCRSSKLQDLLLSALVPVWPAQPCSSLPLGQNRIILKLQQLLSLPPLFTTLSHTFRARDIYYCVSYSRLHMWSLLFPLSLKTSEGLDWTIPEKGCKPSRKLRNTNYNATSSLRNHVAVVGLFSLCSFVARRLSGTILLTVSKVLL